MLVSAPPRRCVSRLAPAPVRHEVVLGDVDARLGQTPEALAAELVPSGEGGGPRIEVLQVSDVELRARLKDGGEPREVLQVVKLHRAHSPSAYLALGPPLGMVWPTASRSGS